MFGICFAKEPFSGHGNSFQGAGGRGNKRAQMRHCLRLIDAVVSSGGETVAQDLCDQGIITQLLSEFVRASCFFYLC